MCYPLAKLAYRRLSAQPFSPQSIFVPKEKRPKYTFYQQVSWISSLASTERFFRVLRVCRPRNKWCQRFAHFLFRKLHITHNFERSTHAITRITFFSEKVRHSREKETFRRFAASLPVFAWIFIAERGHVWSIFWCAHWKSICGLWGRAKGWGLTLPWRGTVNLSPELQFGAFWEAPSLIARNASKTIALARLEVRSRQNVSV